MKNKDGGPSRLTYLLIILLIMVVAFAIIFYFYSPYSEAAKGGRWSLPTPTPTKTPALTRSSTPTSTIFSDDFSESLSKWQVVYLTASIQSGQLDLIPLYQTYNSPSDTHAPLIAAGDVAWKDYIFNVSMKTTRQLRPSNPNPWEVGWLIFRYVDSKNFYYFVHKTNGIELGKLVNGTQKFLYTAGSPTLSLNQFNTYQVTLKGNIIKISINGNQIVNYTDSSSPFLTGKIGLYNEDAETLSDDVLVTAN